MYELLIGKGCRTPVAAPEKYVLSRKSQLKSALAKRMAVAKVSVRFPFVLPSAKRRERSPATLA